MSDHSRENLSDMSQDMSQAFVSESYVTREAVEDRARYIPYDSMKRIFDFFFALLALIVLSPIFLIVSIVIVCESRGAPIYSHSRVGKNGTIFTMYKFRSMCADADKKLGSLRDKNEATGPLFKMAHDPRITRVGAFLRKSSIDELPQLLNILKGDMSFVGPRPALPVEVLKYTPYEMRRLQVLPGLTGIWQISGRSELTFDEYIALDLRYIRERSMLTDLRIILKTVPVVLFERGAC